MLGTDRGFFLMGGLFLLAFAVVVGMVIWSAVGAQKRREALSVTAARHEWTYLPRDDTWVDRFSGLPFGRGFDQRATNVITGRYEDRRFVAFDYRYSTSSLSTDAQGHTTSKTDHHYYSVISLDLGVDLPRLLVTPEGFFGRIVGRLTNTDIELESEQFNRAFTVSCDDRKFASDVLHPQMMEYLLGFPEMAWRCEGGGLVAIRPGEHDPEEVEAKLAALSGIATRIPPFVWQQFGAS